MPIPSKPITPPAGVGRPNPLVPEGDAGPGDRLSPITVDEQARRVQAIDDLFAEWEQAYSAEEMRQDLEELMTALAETRRAEGRAF